MRIANPMYDAASARLLVGAVLGEEIESLEPLPQERSVRASPPPVPGEPTPAELFTVRRVDFAATVRTASGECLRILVEVQKARFTDQVMRFREYLGRHSSSIRRCAREGPHRGHGARLRDEAEP